MNDTKAGLIDKKTGPDKSLGIPEEIKDIAVIDQAERKAYCIDGASREQRWLFLNCYTRLKSMDIVESKVFLPAEKFNVIKNSMDISVKDDTSEMQKYMARLFKEAAKKKASDITIHDYGTHGGVLFCVHKNTYPVRDLAPGLPNRLFNTVYTSMTDQAETSYKRTQPQQARIADPDYLPEGVVSIRVSSSPSDRGAFMVFRIHYERNRKSLLELGFSEKLGHISALRYMMKQPHGMFIIAGPTGSGKTTSFYSFLRTIKQLYPYANLMTVEDPPEYPMENITQIPVMVSSNATDEEKRRAYEITIDAMLRLNPDYTVIGEIRDKASARLALQGAMTGHPLWSTLHASNPFNIITRMVNKLDYPRALKELADVDVLKGMVFQKTVQVLCDECKRKLTDHFEMIDEQLLKRIETKFRFDLGEEEKISLRGEGCKACDFTGISGVTILAEVVCMDPVLYEVVHGKGPNAARREWLAREDMHSIIDHALEKIKDGIIDPAMAEMVVGPLTTDTAFHDGKLDRIEIEKLS